MTFNPIRQKGESAAGDNNDVLETVADAAACLLAALRQAESHTDGWQYQPLGYALVEEALSACLSQLATTGLWGRANQLPSDVLWQVTGAMLETGWLQQRARKKPLGYAGDYELLAAILEERCCEHPLGRLFDRYFQNQAAPSAVRGRTQHAARALAAHAMTRPAEGYQIASVGAGTGMDVQYGLALLPPSVRRRAKVILLELDDRGLRFAQSQVAALAGEENVTGIRENLLRLGRKAGSDKLLGDPSFLICSGLFDYLDDDAAIDLLKLFWRRLATGGRMVVGGFIPSHSTRGYMEWIGNWYLIYRMPDDMMRIAEAAGIPVDCCDAAVDRIGAGLFLTATKP